MRKMREYGYTNVEGLTLNDEDVKACESDGFKVHQVDFNFTGFNEEFDGIWMRHVLEHSPSALYYLSTKQNVETKWLVIRRNAQPHRKIKEFRKKLRTLV